MYRHRLMPPGEVTLREPTSDDHQERCRNAALRCQVWWVYKGYSFANADCTFDWRRHLTSGLDEARFNVIWKWTVWWSVIAPLWRWAHILCICLCFPRIESPGVEIFRTSNATAVFFVLLCQSFTSKRLQAILLTNSCEPMLNPPNHDD